MKDGLYTAIFIVLVFFIEINAATTYKIACELDNGKELPPAFGFIVSESEENLYLVTAAHVIESQDTNYYVTKIFIYFTSREKREAKILRKHPSLDLVLLEMEKFELNFTDFRDMTTLVKAGDLVHTIGRYGEFNQSEDGSVIEVTNKIIKAELKGVAPGSSGGPLCQSASIGQDKIVGMVYEDDGLVVTALTIESVMSFVSETLEIERNYITDLPFLKLGTGLENNFISGYNTVFLSIPDYNDANLFGGMKLSFSLFLELAFSSHFSFLTEYNTISFDDETFEKYLMPANYHNTLQSISLGLKYYTSSQLHVGDFYIMLAYSYGKMNPQININNSQWKEYKELGHEYNNMVNSVKVGIGGGGIVFLNSFYFGIRFEYNYFFTKYLYSDITDPYKKDSGNDYLLKMVLDFGLILRLPSSYTKILR